MHGVKIISWHFGKPRENVKCHCDSMTKTLEPMSEPATPVCVCCNNEDRRSKTIVFSDGGWWKDVTRWHTNVRRKVEVQNGDSRQMTWRLWVWEPCWWVNRFIWDQYLWMVRSNFSRPLQHLRSRKMTKGLPVGLGFGCLIKLLLSETSVVTMITTLNKQSHFFNKRSLYVIKIEWINGKKRSTL